MRPLHQPCGAFAVQIAGRRLELGPVVVSHPKATGTADSRGAALAALTAGRGGLRLVL
ncbi:hypothetical protein [Streptomyces fagopyri]|uniref:hypothetical protein n=1 Tax=Streptomyces fagopyri TaxID=2662397 RepID=UPI0033E1E5E4